jgi:hypothetical protein
MIILVSGVAALFALLLLARLAGAKRADLVNRWPVVAIALGAGLALLRGQIWFALGLAGAAVLAWVLAPVAAARRARPKPRPVIVNDPRDVEARGVLGVGPSATAAEIRAAYRARMARAHPDKGGNHADAARLTAARDRLLRR